MDTIIAHDFEPEDTEDTVDPSLPRRLRNIALGLDHVATIIPALQREIDAVCGLLACPVVDEDTVDH